MAATFLLLVLLLGAQAAAPPPCQGDPMSWCWDVAMATHCGWEQQCQDVWDSLALGNVADGDSVAPVRGFKCSQCTKVLKKIKALAGDDPDEDAVAAALQKGCRLLGRSMGRRCQKFVKKYKDQITEGLQNGDMPQDICAAVGFCRS
ncbi:granulysin isoform X2 [Catharus ustulatus]|uniref:granulysin isoform X2 n=1 Tax=Catharus ustulatus TaxID=91951 RepID=UPI00140CD52B|nr:granulysin isoform X2 [Catharus ustulatus]